MSGLRKFIEFFVTGCDSQGLKPTLWYSKKSVISWEVVKWNFFWTVLYTGYGFCYNVKDEFTVSILFYVDKCIVVSVGTDDKFYDKSVRFYTFLIVCSGCKLLLIIVLLFTVDLYFGLFYFVCINFLVFFYIYVCMYNFEKIL